MKRKDIISAQIDHQSRVLNRLAQSKQTNERGLERLYLCYSNTTLLGIENNAVLHEIEKQLNLKSI